MYLLGLISTVVCFNQLVNGAAVTPDIDRCLFRRCPATIAECDEQTRKDPCCPICRISRRCFHGGKWYDSGESFKADCNSCVCDNGIPLCTLMACPVKYCLYKGKRYSNGETFKDACNTCTCMFGQVSCTEKACGKGCFYKGKFYADGSTFKDDCNTCNCRGGQVGCTKIGCPPSRCYFNGIHYDEGDSIPSKDPCEDCVCRNGRRQCFRRMCPAVWCEGQKRVPGKCCPVCPGGILA